MIACFMLCWFAAGSAQVLARPGWKSSGFNADPWWKHAVFYSIASMQGAPAVERLDALQSLRIDALLLPMPDAQAPGTDLDAFDDLVSQAGRRGIRIVLEVPASGDPQAMLDRTRFWLSRGIAGVYLATPLDGNAEAVQALVDAVRRVASAAVGGRIVISDVGTWSGGSAASPRRRHRRRHRGLAAGGVGVESDISAHLRIASRDNLPDLPDAGTFREVIADESPDPNVMLRLKLPPAPATGINPYAAMDRAIIAIELGTRPAALLTEDINVHSIRFDSRGADDAADADWLRQFIALHHANTTLRDGVATAFDFDSQNALVWVNRSTRRAGQMPPVIVACNVTSLPIHLSVEDSVRRLALRGTYLHTLLRSDDSIGPQSLDDISIPPFGVYVGELHR